VDSGSCLLSATWMGSGVLCMRLHMHTACAVTHHPAAACLCGSLQLHLHRLIAYHPIAHRPASYLLRRACSWRIGRALMCFVWRS
jgi:hypothetical protein